MCVPTLEQTNNIKEPTYHTFVRIFIELYNNKIEVQLFYKCILQYQRAALSYVC